MLKTEKDIPGDYLMIKMAGYSYISRLSTGTEKERLDDDYIYFINTALKSTRAVELPTKEGATQLIAIYMN